MLGVLTMGGEFFPHLLAEGGIMPCRDDEAGNRPESVPSGPASEAGEEIGREPTLDRARGTPFLLPVVVDDTREAAALVPEPFMRLPWTRLPQGAVTPIFPSR